MSGCGPEPLAAESSEEAVALAHANGWERRLDRALGAFSRPTAHDQALIDGLRAKTSFSVTELELFADCSSIWFLERLIDPRTIDGEVDARLRGSIAHQTLFKFFSGLPKELGRSASTRSASTTRSPSSGTCLGEAIDSGVWIELATSSAASSRKSLWRDLENFCPRGGRVAARLSSRGASRSRSALERSAPELQSGLQVVTGFSLTGKIDRTSSPPPARAGSSRTTSRGRPRTRRRKIESELRLQIPLQACSSCATSSASSRSAASTGRSRANGTRGGSLRKDAEDDVPGFSKSGLPRRGRVLGADGGARREHAVSLVERIRAGDIQHDPKAQPPRARPGATCRRCAGCRGLLLRPPPFRLIAPFPGAAKRRLAASSVAPVASGYAGSLRPCDACFSPPESTLIEKGGR